ncbi:MAG: NIPSNAP family protein [Woeseiaceae bacterium]|jgi:ureidoglycolate hydrolase|nr:NIPSNAP family protein [Woeseiaceae bacterium]
MFRRYRNNGLLGLTVFACGIISGSMIQLASVAEAQSGERVFELRTYTTHPGRLDALHARFTNHTIGLFERHGMTNIGYFVPQDAPLAENTLIYVLAHDSREAAEASWAAFIADPEWQAAYQASTSDGPIIDKLESVYMDATDYSMFK